MTTHQHPDHQNHGRQHHGHQHPDHQNPGHQHPHHQEAASAAVAELMQAAMAGADRFGHRQHVLFTWLAVRRYGTSAATGLVCEGIQGVARYAGAPQKYHLTVSRAWVEIIGHHAAHTSTDDFDTFVARNPELFDKRLLMRFYRSATLAGAAARSGWVEPDLAPFPWQDVLP